MKQNETESLLALLKKVADLPEYVHRDAIRSIATEWRAKRPLVDDVVSGRTTFEAAIAELIAENKRLTLLNLKGACNSEAFTALAQQTATKVADILTLRSDPSTPRKIDETIDLTETMSFGRRLWVTLKTSLFIGLSVSVGAWLLIGICNTSVYANWPLAIYLGIGLGLVGFLFFFTVGHPLYVISRRQFAAETLQNARFLDAALRHV